MPSATTNNKNKKNDYTHITIKQLLCALTYFLLAFVIAAISGDWADAKGYEMLRTSELLTSNHSIEIKHYINNIDDKSASKTVVTVEHKHNHSFWYYDTIREFVPTVDLPWLSDAILLCLFPSLIASLLKERDFRIDRLYLYFMVHGSVLYLRSACIFSTIKSPSPIAIEKLVTTDISISYLKSALGWIGNKNCFDMMFSGHSSGSIIMALFCFDCNYSIILKMLALAIGFCGFIIQPIVGDHYTNDAVIGCYTSILVYLLFRPRLLATIHHNNKNTITQAKES